MNKLNKTINSEILRRMNEDKSSEQKNDCVCSKMYFFKQMMTQIVLVIWV